MSVGGNRTDGRTDVLAFPGAGGFGGEFGPLRAAVAGHARVRPVLYPGRVGRSRGQPASSFAGLVEWSVEHVLAWSSGYRILVGHSFGACVAYSTAVGLTAVGEAVGALIVAGADDPGRMGVPEGVDGPAATGAFLAGIGAFPPGAGQDPDWAELVIETAVQDLALLRGFPGPARTRLSCPVLAVRGEDDPITAEERMTGWAGITSGAAERTSYPGDHVSVLGSPEFLDRVAGVVVGAMPGAPGRGHGSVPRPDADGAWISG